MTASLRLGLVGTGYWADVTHATAAVAAPSWDLAAVWGRDAGRAAALAERHGAPHAGTDFDAFLAQVDAVTFAVPPQLQSELAVRAIRAAGGVPVFAHPGADARGRIVPDRVFDRLAAAGLGGIEVDHRDHSPAQRERLTAIARRLGLLVTGSSDYHGSGKVNRLGEHLTDPEVLSAIEDQGATAVVRA